MAQEMSTAHKAALDYVAAGFSVIPIRADGSKAPLIPFEPFFTRLAMPSEIARWYDEHPEAGVAILGGAISGNLLVYDFDEDGFYEQWAEAVESIAPGLLAQLPVVRTPKGYGRHVYARAPATHKGEKLARLPTPDGPAPWRVAIETRGEHQYVLAPGCSVACHSTGRVYELVSGPFVEETPTLTADQIDVLTSVARGLDRYVEERNVVGASAPDAGAGKLVWDDYRKRGSWEELLRSHGWWLIKNRESESWWRRPGKTGLGISATLGHCRTPDGERLLYVFSTNAAPLEAGKCYNLFGAFVALSHGGSAKAAARALIEQGYGGEVCEADIAEAQTAIEAVKARLALGHEATSMLNVNRFSALMETERKFKKAWSRQREDFDDDQLKYDAALLWYALRFQWPLEEAVAMLYSHRLAGKVSTEQALDAGYVAKRLAWLRKEKAPTDTGAVVFTERQAVADGPRSDLVERARKMTGISDFLGILQTGREQEMYHIRHANGRLTCIGPVDVYLSQPRFRQELLRHQDILIPSMKGWEWDALHGIFLQVKETVEYPDEDRDTQFADLVSQYLMGSSLADGTRGEAAVDSAVRLGYPFLDKDLLWLNLPSFYHWLDSTMRAKAWPDRRVRACMRSLGFQHHQVARGGVRKHYHAVRVDGPFAPVLEAARRRHTPAVAWPTEPRDAVASSVAAGRRDIDDPDHFAEEDAK